MAELVCSAITSLDGYLEDRTGGFDWGVPDDEVMAFLNDLVRPIGTYLYGRRMYETMRYWEPVDETAQRAAADRDWAELWRAADKVVYSRTLERVSTARTRLVREFDPGAVAAMKDSLDADLSIGGPGLAAHAFRAGLVDRCQLFLTPVVVGGGKPALPTDGRIDLELLTERRFAGGFVFLDYRVR